MGGKGNKIIVFVLLSVLLISCAPSGCDSDRLRQIAELQRQISDIQANYESLRLQYDQKIREIIEYEEEIGSMRDEIDSLSRINQDISSDNQRMIDIITNLEEQSQSFRNMIR